MNNTASKHSTN